MKIKYKLIVLLVTLFILSLQPSVFRTFEQTRDFRSLVILATLSDKDFSINPYSPNFYWIRQESALRIIKEFDYHYQEIDKSQLECVRQKIQYVTGLIGIVSSESENRVYEIIDHLLDIDEDSLNVHDCSGLTPLHTAIFDGNLNYVEYLLKVGADTSVEIKRKGKRSDGLDAREFAMLMVEIDPEKYQSVYELVSNYESI